MAEITSLIFLLSACFSFNAVTAMSALLYKKASVAKRHLLWAALHLGAMYALRALLEWAHRA